MKPRKAHPASLHAARTAWYRSPAPTTPAPPAAPYRQGVSSLTARITSYTTLVSLFIITPLSPYHESQIRQPKSDSDFPPPPPAPPSSRIMAQFWRAFDRAWYRVSLGYLVPEARAHSSLVGCSCERLPPFPRALQHLRFRCQINNSSSA